MKFHQFIFSTIICCICFSLHAATFQDTKKQARIIWAEHRETLYCHCPFDKQGNINYAQCAYNAQDQHRGKKMEWEHVVPVSWFGRTRPCWHKPLCMTKNGKRYKGRNCCEKMDPEFRLMYTDLHNLVPVIGEINKMRSYFKFGEFTENPLAFLPLFNTDEIHHQKKRRKSNRMTKNVQNIQPGYGACDFIISEKDKMIEPPNEDKGLIARVFLYMHAQYGLSFSDKELKMFYRWNQDYPPSPWEIRWNQKVKAIQDTDNTFISRFHKNI